MRSGRTLPVPAGTVQLRTGDQSIAGVVVERPPDRGRDGHAPAAWLQPPRHPAFVAATELPKGSFYHHFESKEAFALAVVDRYMVAVHQGLDATLLDERVAPLQRIRNFFEATRESYKGDGYLGCLLGGLGQELSGVNETFRARIKPIERCIGQIASKIEVCLRLAVARGDVVANKNPRHIAALLVNCWEGAALRTRLLRDPAPLGAMLDFYFESIRPPSARKKPMRGARKRRPASA